MAVVTELTIDGSGATRGAKEYESAMDRAQAAMQRGLGAMSTEIAKTRDQMTLLAVSFAALPAPINAVLQLGMKVLGWAVETNRALADMGLSAKRANLDIERFQQLQVAAAGAGVDSKTFSSGVEGIATKLNDAMRSENEMSKLLDANNVKWKEGNKLLLDTDKLLDVARDLIYRARNEQDKIKMAEMLGLTKEWVPLLDQSAKAFGDSQKEVTALGLVINRETIERAAEFDKEWRKAAEVFSVWMKARLVDLLPFVDDLIAKATSFKESVSSVIQSPDAALAARRMEVVTQLFADATAEGNLAEAMDIAIVSAKLLAGTLGEETKALIDQRIAANDADKAWEDFGKRWQETRDRMEKAAAIPLPTAKPGDLTSFKPSVVPDKEEKDGGRDFWDRAIDSIDKHIARLKADAIAVGQNVGVHEQLRSEFALLEAAKQADKGVTDEQIEAYTKLRASMSATQALTKAGIELEDDDVKAFKAKTEAINAAALALEKIKVASDIKRDTATLFLNSTDLEIANKLKGLYGDDIPAALASSEAAAMRLNAQLKLTQELATDALKSFLSDVRSGKAPLDAFANALTKISDKLTDKGLDNLVKMMSGGGGFGFGAANDNTAASVQQGILAAQKDAMAQAARGSGGGYYGGSPAGNPNLVPFGAPGGGPNYALGGIAGIGGLISSYRAGQATASPTQGAVSGGLTGALSGAGIGAMIGGPIGALIGGGIGLIGGALAGLFGGTSQQKQQQEQQLADARQAWRDMSTQITELENLFTGAVFGDLTQSIRSARGDLDKALQAASAAQDTGAVNRLTTEWNAFVDRKRGEFQASFGVMLDAFRDGLGENSPLVQAKANVVALGEKLKGFVADTQQAFGGGDTAFGSFGAGAANAAVQIEQAQEAARQMALAALAGVTPLTDTAKRLLEIKGTAQGLQQVLVDLGLSADGAAQAIAAGTIAALDKLKASFSDTLTRDINAATGKGFLNDIGDLVAKFQQMQADATALGADPSLLTRWLDVSAQKIINDAQLTGKSFDDLIMAFPQLAGAVTAFSATVTRSAQDIAQTQQSFQDQLFTLGQDQTTLAGQLAVFDLQAQRAREDEIAKGGQALADLEALQGAQRLNVIKSFNDKMLADTQRALEEAQNFIQGITRRIKEYLDGLKSGSESPLSPSARLSAAQAAYNQQLALSQVAGPNQRDALNGITQYADSLLDAAKSFYGSASGFQTIFNNIQTQLGALPSQISPEQFIVDAITSQTASLSTAIATGSAAAIATALFPMFDSIDTNMDDNISLPEMITALGSSFSAGTLQSIFSKLDGNGNGLLTKAELQGAIATNILTNTLTTASGTQSTAAGTGSVLLSNQAQESLLNALIGLNTTASTQLSLLTQQFTNTGSFQLSGAPFGLQNQGQVVAPTMLAIPTIQNAMLTALNKIVWNTFATAQNTVALARYGSGSSIGVGVLQYGTYATGGLVMGAGSGTSDSNLARVSNGEFIMNAAATMRNLPMLRAMNDNLQIGGFGDTGAVVSELRIVGAKIDRLARMVGDGTELTASVRDGIMETAEEMRDMIKWLKRKAA